MKLLVIVSRVRFCESEIPPRSGKQKHRQIKLLFLACFSLDLLVHAPAVCFILLRRWRLPQFIPPDITIKFCVIFLGHDEEISRFFFVFVSSKSRISVQHIASHIFWEISNKMRFIAISVRGIRNGIYCDAFRFNGPRAWFFPSFQPETKTFLAKLNDDSSVGDV